MTTFESEKTQVVMQGSDTFDISTVIQTHVVQTQFNSIEPNLNVTFFCSTQNGHLAY